MKPGDNGERRSNKMKSPDFFQVCELLAAADLLNMSAEELAIELGCNPLELNGFLQEHFGFSMAALKLELRLLEAARQLREPGTTIATVTEQCHFGPLNLFLTCFQRRFGVAPSRWREQRDSGKTISIEPGIIKLLERMPELRTRAGQV